MEYHVPITETYNSQSIEYHVPIMETYSSQSIEGKFFLPSCTDVHIEGKYLDCCSEHQILEHRKDNGKDLTGMYQCCIEHSKHCMNLDPEYEFKSGSGGRPSFACTNQSDFNKVKSLLCSVMEYYNLPIFPIYWEFEDLIYSFLLENVGWCFDTIRYQPHLLRQLIGLINEQFYANQKN